MTKYDTSKSSDMRRFEQNLKKTAEELAKKQLEQQTFDINCPNCGSPIHVRVGKNICPVCNAEVNFHLTD